MKKAIKLLAISTLLCGMSAQANMWPAQPFGTAFAPWNTMRGGFAPLNNTFPGSSPWGMSPFAGNRSPWDAVAPYNTMPWNAWRGHSGSIVPYMNSIPFSNNTGNIMFPTMHGVTTPWGNGWNGSNFSGIPWMGGGWNPNRYRNNNDILRTFMLLQSINANTHSSGLPIPGLTPGLAGIPTATVLPGYNPYRPLSNHPVMGTPAVPGPPITGNQFAPTPTPVASPSNQRPPVSAPQQPDRSFNPFAAPETAPGDKQNPGASQLRFPDATSDIF